MTRHTKKVVIFSVIFFFFVIAPHVSAEGFTALAPIPGLTDAPTVNSASGLGQNTLATFFNNLYKYLIGLAAVIAIIEIILGGLEISTKDSVSKNSLGKERIYNALLGLVLVLSPVLVFSIINPTILNLSLNLPPLNATPTTTSGSGTTAPGTGVTPPPANPALTAAIAAGCTVVVPNKTISCTNRPAAQTFADACPNNSGSISQVPYPNWQATCATALQSACVTSGILLKTASCASLVDAQGFVAECGAGRGRLLACPNVNADGSCSTAYRAVCESADTGPFVFLDVSSVYIPSLGSPLLFSSYEPLVSSIANANNGAEALEFARKCSQDGGMTCINRTFSTVPCGSFATPQPSTQNNKCYSNTVKCIENLLPRAHCEVNPKWTPK